MISKGVVVPVAVLFGFFGAAGLAAQEQEYDRPPKPTHITSPDYPEAARDGGIEGTVVIEMTIDEEGRVKDPRVLESVEGLDDAAVACVTRWTFAPALRAGKAVSARARAPVAFRLQDADR